MTEIERAAIACLVYALRRHEYGHIAGKSCPTCGNRKAYGGIHKCSCPVNIAWKKAVSIGLAIPLMGPPPEPLPPGPFTLQEIPLEEWARWQWFDVTTGVDRYRMFMRGKARTPDEIASALKQYAELRQQLPDLFQEGSAHP